MAATVFHISGERGWRGGENQMKLLVDGLGPAWHSEVIVDRRSELARRLDERGPILLDGTGFMHPASAWRLRVALATGAPALIHAHSSKALETALMARIGTGVPLVFSRRNAFSVSSGGKYRWADAVIAVSDAARRQLLAAGVADERITVIFDAVDAEPLTAASPQRLGIDARAVVFLSAASFEAEKDHFTLLRAWQAVEAAAPDAHLLLAGTGSLQEAAVRLVGELGLRRVKFLGWRDDVPDLIAGCDVAVLSSRAEGLASFLCEAQWCGKPVVATDAGGIGEAVAAGETGLLSPVGDAEALAANMLRLAGDVALRRRLGEAGKLRARRQFALDRIIAAHEDVYRTVLGTKGPLSR